MNAVRNETKKLFQSHWMMAVFAKRSRNWSSVGLAIQSRFAFRLYSSGLALKLLISIQ